MNPELAPADWSPRFVDYLYLAFTNATALSPTDAMPIAHWAKLAMMVQSVSSLAILGLVIARAVNVFAYPASARFSRPRTRRRRSRHRPG